MASNSMFSQIGILERLKGRENYDSWRISARAALELSGLWGYVDGSSTETDATKKADGEMRAKAKLTLMVEPINYSHLQSAKTASEIWKNLETAFNDSGLMRRVGLLRTLINTRLENCASIEEFVNTVTTTAHKLKGTGMTVDDEWIGTVLLAGLGDEYRPMIMAIESSGNKISSDFVKTKLLQDVHCDSTTNGGFSNALYMGKQRYSGGNGNCNGGKNHNDHNNRDGDSNNNDGRNGSSGGRTKFGKNIKCYECNNYGHIARFCPKRTGQKSDDSATEAASLFCFNARHSSSNDWYIDSGASQHMTGEQGWMVNKRAASLRSVVVANNFHLPVKCIGDVNLTLDLGESMTATAAVVRNVLYVPGLCVNLLSVSQMMAMGNSVMFTSGGCEIFNAKGKLIGTANLIDGMYKLNQCAFGRSFMSAGTSGRRICASNVDLNEHIGESETVRWRRENEYKTAQRRCAKNEKNLSNVSKVNDMVDINQFYFFCVDENEIEVEEIVNTGNEAAANATSIENDDDSTEKSADADDSVVLVDASIAEASNDSGSANTSLLQKMQQFVSNKISS